MSILIIFSRTQLLILLMFSIAFLVSVSFISTLIFIISFFLLTLGLVFFFVFFPGSLSCKVRLCFPCLSYFVPRKTESHGLYYWARLALAGDWRLEGEKVLGISFLTRPASVLIFWWQLQPSNQIVPPPWFHHSQAVPLVLWGGLRTVMTFWCC